MVKLSPQYFRTLFSPQPLQQQSFFSLYEPILPLFTFVKQLRIYSIMLLLPQKAFTGRHDPQGNVNTFDFKVQAVVKCTKAQWFRTTMNWDVSTKPLAHLFAGSLPLLNHSLAPHCLLHLRTPLHSFVWSFIYSLPRFWQSQS